MSYRHIKLIPVGFWWSEREPQWPRVEMMIGHGWSPAERAIVLDYVRNGQEHASYKGWSNCRLCGRPNGSRDLTDGTYVWPEGFGHYIEQHGVRPPAGFVAHVLRSYPGAVR